MSVNLNVESAQFRRFLALCAISFTLFVTYGSLVPFEGRDYSLAQAIDMFAGINYLQLGVNSRADWIANALIYLPVGYFWCGYLRMKGAGLASQITVVAGLLILIVSVEFLQIFVAPRTVSLNDLIAESIGLVLGYGLWTCTGAKFIQIVSSIQSQGRIALPHLLILYLVFYLLFALFPYDFYISLNELTQGFSKRSISIFTIPDGNTGLRYVILRIVDLMVAVPVGLLVCRAKLIRNQWQLVLVFVPALLVIELLQVFMETGTVLLFAVVLKTAGLLLGWQMEARYPITNWLPNQAGLLKILTILMLPYFFFVALYKGWNFSGGTSFSHALGTLAETNFLPFYYHYYVTEVRALISLLIQTAMVAPLGCYLYFYDSQRSRHFTFASLALLGAVFALVFELGALFLSGLRPDPTNLLIAAFSVYASYYFTGLIYRSLTILDEPLKPLDSARAQGELHHQNQNQKQLQLAPPSDDHQSEHFSGPAEAGFVRPLLLGKCLSMIFAVLLITYCLNYPLLNWLFLIGLLITFSLLWRWPGSWLILLPMGIPLLDLYVISGRFFLTELDALILLILAINYWRGHYEFQSMKKDPWFNLILLGLVFSYLFSLAQVLMPWPSVEVNSFNSFYSPFNGLRITKSLMWSLLLLPLLEFQFVRNPKAIEQFAWGMLAGFLLLSMVILLERSLFANLLDFLWNFYRVKGSFSSMHTGGAHIDAYLVMALPFVAIPFFKKSSPHRVLAALMLLGLGLYVVFVTYSRAPFAVTFFLSLMMLGGFLITSGRGFQKRMVVALVLIFGSLSMYWLSLPFLYETVLSQRLVDSERDTGSRMSHWKTAISLVKNRDGSLFWGNGPGSFPYHLFIEHSLVGKNIAVHDLMQEKENYFLRMSSGDNIYTNQYVNVNPKQKYILKFRARSHGTSGSLLLPLCQKWIMESFRCVTSSFDISTNGQWRDYQKQLSMEKLSPTYEMSNWIIQRPIVLSVFSSGVKQFLDIDDIHLLDGQGKNILRNGGFEHGKDRWYFEADNHMLWHTKNIFVNLYHDFGLVGLALILVLTGLLVFRLIILIWRGQQLAVIFLASICGFYGIGLIGSLFDVPQLSLLFYLLLFNSAKLWQNRDMVSRSTVIKSEQ